MAPNGIIAHLFGPIEGRRHDAFMLNVSGLMPKLERITTPNGLPYVIYGDPAYGISQHVISHEFYCCVMYSGVEYVVCCYSECISHTRQAEKSA